MTVKEYIVSSETGAIILRLQRNVISMILKSTQYNAVAKDSSCQIKPSFTAGYVCKVFNQYFSLTQCGIFCVKRP